MASESKGMDSPSNKLENSKNKYTDRKSSWMISMSAMQTSKTPGVSFEKFLGDPKDIIIII